MEKERWLKKSVAKLFAELFDKNIPSVIFITFAYFAFNWGDIYSSPYFNNIKFTAFVILLLIIQWLVSKLYRSNYLLLKIISIFIVSSFIIFWFGYYVEDFVVRWQNEKFHSVIIRGRVILLIVSLIVFSLEFLVALKRGKNIFIQNTFFAILFCVIIFIFFTNSSHSKEITSISNRCIPIKSACSEYKPTILIITDEYNSPDGLVKIFKDSSLYYFSNNLKKKGWIVKNHFFSHEISTISSLSSLFNFNLSNEKNFSKMSINVIGTEKLIKCTLADSLSKKNTSIINYGIFDFGKSKPINRLFYIYPKTFTELLVNKTIYPAIQGRPLSLEALSFNPVEHHNKYILNTLIDTLRANLQKKQFVYVHLLMPHGPMVFSPIIKFKDQDNNPKHYLAYWKFTNIKLSSLLNVIASLHKYRIILTGDHGYRGCPSIDPHYTFTAFYGFDKNDIKKLHSVQDLGSLINGYN
ncbi:sulfatase-like hydrolase/transferase [Paludibacter sp.]|uniref:sulfatase-like hydrolase/transferase n=1 Tax=Paludibacter sp. TaxID=1898105 RepID=UPI001352B043|nr:sulfatase-like hydrolase/transferase [Paludibacter sp.]MTK52791.1 hypothetical protein [Paludibacter sp.]